ncbi:MAG TPA: undecaprenyl-diphosphatase UppP [Blastocatellia bacterium]|nr:undecaprenyl-diphosphatase UppP [Blastocatellia bacterium]
MSLWQALVLGLIQGLTEFIPISSTAHLTLAGNAMGLISRDHPEEWTAFIAVTQLGTLLAVVVYFWSDIGRIVHGFVTGNVAALRKRSVHHSVRQSTRLGWLIIVGTIPISIAGLTLRQVIEGELTKDPWVIAGSLLGVAVMLTVAEVLATQRRDMTGLKLSDAVVVGIAQAFALIPGSSRSGTTITGGLLAGLTRETAARFSFLLSIPAIFASGLLELPKAVHSIGTNWPALALATTVSAISGYASIAFLLRYLQRHTTFLFVAYRLLLGVVLVALLVSGTMSAR